MPWDYRVIRTADQCTIHEVYYREDSAGAIEGYSAAPAYPRGDTLEELIDDLRRYSDAVRRPVLFEKEDGSLANLNDSG